jgi:hypothetical protein
MPTITDTQITLRLANLPDIIRINRIINHRKDSISPSVYAKLIFTIRACLVSLQILQRRYPKKNSHSQNFY